MDVLNCCFCTVTLGCCSVAQLCLTVWDPMDCSMLGFLVLFESESDKLLSRVWLFTTPWTVAHQAPLSMGILQARILEWVAIPSSRGSSWPRDQTCASCASCIAGRLFTFWATGEVLPVLFGEPQIIVTCKISVLQKPTFSPWEWYRLRSLLYIWP